MPCLCRRCPVPQEHIIGVLPMGREYNSEGLQRHALPPHLPPPLASDPFLWVTLDLKRLLPMLASGGACWACAYLQMAPQYSPAGAVTLWAWLRETAMLSMLLAGATQATKRK